jgi:hypothetical protein
MANARRGVGVLDGQRRAFDGESHCQDMNSLSGSGGAKVEHASMLNRPELT